MRQRLLSHLTYANVISTLCLFLLLGGGTAVALSGSNTVFSDDIVNGQVQTPDLATGAATNSKLANGAVNSSKVADNSLTGADVANGSLGIGDLSFPLGIGGKTQTTPIPAQQGQFVEVINDSFTMPAPGDVVMTGAVEVIDDAQTQGPTSATVRVVIDQTVQPASFSGQIPPAASSAIPVVIPKSGVAKGPHTISVQVNAVEAGAMVGDRSIAGIIGPMF